MIRNLMLEINHDYDVDMPDSCYDGWQLVSFGRKHNNYEDSTKYVKTFDGGNVTPANVGLARKLKVGLAFFLSYYEHGLGCWSLIGEGNQDQWDTAYLAGILIWSGKPNDIGAKSLEGRAKDARDFLRSYNFWANGQTYWFRLSIESGEVIESFGGLVGVEALSEFVGEELRAGDNLKVLGDAARIRNSLRLPNGVNVVECIAEPVGPTTPECVV
jgi:hypothetical protein